MQTVSTIYVDRIGAPTAWCKTPVDSTSQVTGDRIYSVHVGYPDMAAYPQRQNNRADALARASQRGDIKKR